MTRVGDLFTLGYAGLRGPDDLRRLLEGTPVSTIVDIRLSRWSRNRAFSGLARQTVEAAGLRYLYVPDLGNLAYRTGGIQIKDVDAIEEVLALVDAGEAVGLMCACRQPQGCHRADVADEAARRRPGLQVVHLVRNER
ncbi:MAG: hypothetical protein ACYDAN_02510 [Candidatus Limnocylindrales bacterium]